MASGTPCCPVSPAVNSTTPAFCPKTGESSNKSANSSFYLLLNGEQKVPGGEAEDSQPESNERKLQPGSQEKFPGLSLEVLAVLSSFIRSVQLHEPIHSELLVRPQDGIISPGVSEKRAVFQAGILNPELSHLLGIKAKLEEGGPGNLRIANQPVDYLKFPDIERAELLHLLLSAKGPPLGRAEIDCLRAGTHRQAGKSAGGQVASSTQEPPGFTAQAVLTEPAEQAFQAVPSKPDLLNHEAFSSTKEGGRDSETRLLSPDYNTAFEGKTAKQAFEAGETLEALKTKALFSRDNNSPQAASMHQNTQFGSHLPTNNQPDGALGKQVAQEIVQQVVEKAHLHVGKETATLKIQLKPEFLGKLDLIVSLERGFLHARFLAENPAVVNLIETRLPELRQSLEQQGISWQQVSVSVDSQADQGFSQSHPEAQSAPQPDLPSYPGVLEGGSEREKIGKIETSPRGILGLVDYLV